MGGLGKVHGIVSVKKVKHIPKCNVECIEIKGERAFQGFQVAFMLRALRFLRRFDF